MNKIKEALTLYEMCQRYNLAAKLAEETGMTKEVIKYHLMDHWGCTVSPVSPRPRVQIPWEIQK